MVKGDYSGNVIWWSDKEYTAIQEAKDSRGMEVAKDTYFASEYVARVTKALKQVLLFADD